MASTAQILRALMSGDRLALIIALKPEAADVIPRGPQLVARIAARLGDEVALNPQPLPPKEIGTGKALMHKITEAALGGPDTFGDQLLRDVDDWCGTGWPRRWPKGWPVLGPSPEPWEVGQLQLGGLLAAAEISAHYDDPEIVAVFDKAIDLLGEAAVSALEGRR